MFVSFGTHLTSSSSRLFRNAHHHGFLSTAAYGGLKPPPAWRLRGARPHLRLSMARRISFSLLRLLGTPTPETYFRSKLFSCVPIYHRYVICPTSISCEYFCHINPKHFSGPAGFYFLSDGSTSFFVLNFEEQSILFHYSVYPLLVELVAPFSQHRPDSTISPIRMLSFELFYFREYISSSSVLWLYPLGL